MSHRFKEFLVTSSSVLLLMGCQSVWDDSSVVRDHSKDYLISDNGKSLKVPTDLAADTISAHYLIPDQADNLKLVSNIAPPGSQVTQYAAPIKQPALDDKHLKFITIDKQKDALVIAQPYQLAWLSLHAGLKRQRFPILEADQDKQLLKVADTYEVDSGFGEQWQLYYLQINQQSNKTLVSLKPVNAKQRYNKHIEQRLLKQIAAGLQGKYKQQNLFESFKNYV